ncbi:MAG TPA: zinc ribbon domain-containing protein [bacterium]|nr:zinc ribbon domain-containing protein [bacterium]
MIQFVSNTSDHCTEAGYQFEFHCDRCNNGWMSKFQPSVLGAAESALKAAGALFGGILGRGAQSLDYIRENQRGAGRDAALEKAVQEGKAHFKQCGRCGKWVCPEVCWNNGKQLCVSCAPDLAREAAAAQAEAAVEQVREKARTVDHVKDVDMTKDLAAACPKCNASLSGSSKFCPECGTAINVKAKCKQCGTEMDSHAKFCPECGAKNGG